MHVRPLLSVWREILTEVRRDGVWHSSPSSPAVAKILRLVAQLFQRAWFFESESSLRETSNHFPGSDSQPQESGNAPALQLIRKCPSCAGWEERKIKMSGPACLNLRLHSSATTHCSRESIKEVNSDQASCSLISLFAILVSRISEFERSMSIEGKMSCFNEMLKGSLDVLFTHQCSIYFIVQYLRSTNY
jgi:hypothetical protein